MSNCASAACDVSNEDITRESVTEIWFPKTQSTISRPPNPAIRPRLQKLEPVWIPTHVGHLSLFELLIR